MRQHPMTAPLFDETARNIFYDVLYARRDVRSEFIDKAIESETLMRILKAAHHAPSVGFMQPWDFIIVRDHAKREKIKNEFEIAHKNEKQNMPLERQKKYSTLKLEGIIESDLGIVVTCDRNRANNIPLGRTKNIDMDIYSTVCAIQNLWLAARAENIGIGWVSILDYEILKTILNIPDHLKVIAYLCVGYVNAFHATPDLERHHWRSRKDLEQFIHFDHW